MFGFLDFSVLSEFRKFVQKSSSFKKSLRSTVNLLAPQIQTRLKTLSIKLKGGFTGKKGRKFAYIHPMGPVTENRR